MKFLALDELMKPKTKTAAEQSREDAIKAVANWLRNLPDGAIIGTRQHDRAIVLEVEA